jgi:hypothetical protein
MIRNPERHLGLGHVCIGVDEGKEVEMAGAPIVERELRVALSGLEPGDLVLELLGCGCAGSSEDRARHRL